MNTVKKIDNALVGVNNEKVREITALKNSEQKFIDKNLKACNQVANYMKKADKVYLNAMKKYGNDASVENAYNCEVAKMDLLACVDTYNTITKNINESMVEVQNCYAQLNAAVGIVDPAKAAKQATDFQQYNAKIDREIGKIQKSLTNYPHI